MAGSDIRPGQLVMVGIPGTELDDESRSFLRDQAVPGVVLFRRNVADMEQLAALTGDIRDLRPDFPPIVAIDHEGGRVQRLDEPFTHFPPAAVLGRAGSPHLAYRQGQAMGEELRAVDIDLDFAPVLDVDSNPKNPVIGDRSFGPWPKTVGRMGVSVLHGLQRARVIPCGKHFPGHGDTALDSHLDLPVVRKRRADLERCELYPFRRAIQSGVDCIMTAHVVYSALDPVNPATLSHRIVTELLRKQLHFRGVVLSDDMEMKAIADRHGTGDAAVRAVEAGVDGLLYCQSLDAATEAIGALEAERRRRPSFRQSVEQSAVRLDRLRRNHFRRLRRPRESPLLPPEGIERNRKLATWIEERAAGKA